MGEEEGEGEVVSRALAGSLAPPPHLATATLSLLKRICFVCP